MFTPIPGYQRAVVKTTQRTGSTPRRADLPARYTFHVTVGIRLYDYPYPPQYTIAWGGGRSFQPGTTLDLRSRYVEVTGHPIVTLDEGDVLRLQHCELGKTGYALEGDSRGETNHAGLTNIQCEYTLPASNDPAYFADWEYDIIARETATQIQAARTHFGEPTLIDPHKIIDWKGSAAYGYDDPYEMTRAEWYAWDGLNGHVDVPYQSHWDPGNWDHRLLQSKIINHLEEPIMEVIRVGGDNREHTAALASQFDWRPSDVAVISRDSWADGLTAAAKVSTVLYTRPDALPPATVAELRRLQSLAPRRAVVMGGHAVISEDVSRAIAKL